MRRYVAYAVLVVAGVALVLWVISVAAQPALLGDPARLLLLAGVVVVAAVAVLGGLNNVTELVRKLLGRTIDDGRTTTDERRGAEQVIVARESTLDNVSQSLNGPGSQSIDAEKSRLQDVKQDAGGSGQETGDGGQESGDGGQETGVRGQGTGHGGQEPKSDEEGAMNKDLESQQRQLREMEANLRLIEERKAEFVMQTEVPLTLVKEERKLRERIAEMKDQIRGLEVQGSGGARGDTSLATVTAGVASVAQSDQENGGGVMSGGYYSCFISYSSKDEGFAEKLHGDLEGKGVECWFAPEDMKIGDKIRQRIDDEIRQHGKLLLVLTQNSVASDWVESEVEAAFEKERQSKTTVLFPIRLDDAVMSTQAAWAAEIRRTRHIGDFTKWQDAGAYDKGLVRLLRDLTK